MDPNTRNSSETKIDWLGMEGMGRWIKSLKGPRTSLGKWTAGDPRYVLFKICVIIVLYA